MVLSLGLHNKKKWTKGALLQRENKRLRRGKKQQQDWQYIVQNRTTSLLRITKKGRNENGRSNSRREKQQQKQNSYSFRRAKEEEAVTGRTDGLCPKQTTRQTRNRNTSLHRITTSWSNETKVLGFSRGGNKNNTREAYRLRRKTKGKERSCSRKRTDGYVQTIQMCSLPVTFQSSRFESK